MEKQVATFLLGATVAAALIFILIQRPPAAMVMATQGTHLQATPTIVIEPHSAAARQADLPSLPPDEPLSEQVTPASPAIAQAMPVPALGVSEPAPLAPKSEAKPSAFGPAVVPVQPATPLPPAPVIAAVRTPAFPLPQIASASPAPAPLPQRYQQGPAERRTVVNGRAPRIVTLRAGTLLYIRLAETVTNELARPGDHFTATLDAPLVIDGLVIAERGAWAEGRVTESEPSANVPGTGRLAITLTQFDSSDGQRVHVRTQNYGSISRWNRDETIAQVGAATGIGAAIGAAAGGGKGAAIGAIIGGVAGTSGVLLTHGRGVRIPAESLVTFRVEAPVDLIEHL